jgi:hypothetical protein
MERVVLSGSKSMARYSVFIPRHTPDGVQGAEPTNDGASDGYSSFVKAHAV